MKRSHTRSSEEMAAVEALGRLNSSFRRSKLANATDLDRLVAVASKGWVLTDITWRA